jgi:surfactin synthase thioesterase subunit
MANPPWLVEIADSHSRERVFYAIPHAGAGASAVRMLCRDLRDGFDTVAVRFPGRESRMDESPITDLAVLADGLAAQIGEHAGDRGIYLYGHCSGAIAAFETARRLDPGRLALLVVSAHQAPDRIPDRSTWTLPTQEFLTKVAGDGYLPEAVVRDPELSALVEPALRADYQAVESYGSPPGAVASPILALIGTEEGSVAIEDVRAWAAWTSGGFDLRVVPGGHNLLLGPAAPVAAAIRDGAAGLLRAG